MPAKIDPLALRASLRRLWHVYHLITDEEALGLCHTLRIPPEEVLEWSNL